MSSPWLAILLVLGLLTLVMAGLKLASARCHLHPESSRKAVHIAMGLVTLTFPWLFREVWPVSVLALLAMGALMGTRLIAPVRERFGNVLHGVERHSLGEVYFPLAVAALFLLAKDNRLLYIIPLLTLTLADAVAALVGVRYGQHRYATSEGSKSAEGSLAFFLVTFLSAHVPLLLLSDTGRAESLLIALVLGILVMLFEAVSTGGLDNLFIPLGCYALLRRYLTLGADELIFRLVAIGILAVMIFAWRRRTTLKESGLLAAALVGYMNWALGDWQWLAVSLTLFLTYALIWPRSADNDHPVHTVRAVASVAMPGMLWLLASIHTGMSFIAPFTMAYGSHSVMIGMTQLGYARAAMPPWQRQLHAVMRSWLLFLPLFFLPVVAGWLNDGIRREGELSTALMAAVVTLPLLLVTATLHRWVGQRYGDSDDGFGRWLRRALIAGAVSLAGWALVQICWH